MVTDISAVTKKELNIPEVFLTVYIATEAAR